MDNYDIWLAEDIRRERWRESRPVCDFCGDHIQDEHVYAVESLSGTVYLCESCAEEYADELADEFKREKLESWKRDNF